MAPIERETVIVDRGSRGPGSIIIAVVVVLALLVAAYFLFFNNNGGGGTVDVDVPAVSVDVVPDGQ